MTTTKNQLLSRLHQAVITVVLFICIINCSFISNKFTAVRFVIHRAVDTLWLHLSEWLDVTLYFHLFYCRG